MQGVFTFIMSLSYLTPTSLQNKVPLVAGDFWGKGKSELVSFTHPVIFSLSTVMPVFSWLARNYASWYVFSQRVTEFKINSSRS